MNFSHNITYKDTTKVSYKELTVKGYLEWKSWNISLIISCRRDGSDGA